MSEDAFELPEHAVAIRDSRMKRVAEHLPESDDLSLIALKGHLLAEEALSDIARVYCASPELLDDDRLSFSAKLIFAKAVAPRGVPAYIWTSVAMLNSLRNVLSHRLESPEARKRLRRYLQHVENVVPDNPWIDRQNEAAWLKGAIIWTLVCLAAVQARTKEYRDAGH
ncbi:hypothetical protein ACFW0P_10910 [Lysobacter soli]|uniref:hypothetical protein n=1 Tax=Lysobacter soli TaxID=453783 RepID=UPI0036A575E4